MARQQASQQFSHTITSGENDASVVFSSWELITVITISLSILLAKQLLFLSLKLSATDENYSR